MEAWVYHGRSTREQANALVEKLRASKEFSIVIPASSRHYKGEIHKDAVVFHDGSRRDLVWANTRLGVECRQFAGSEMDLEVAPTGDPAPTEPAAAEPASTEPAREEVIQNGVWFTAFRNGEKVGTSQRSEADAWAQLRRETPS